MSRLTLLIHRKFSGALAAREGATQALWLSKSEAKVGGASLGRCHRTLRLCQSLRQSRDGETACRACANRCAARRALHEKQLGGLVYHEREGAEIRTLQEAIEVSVQTDPQRREMQTVKRTILDQWKDEGRAEEAICSRQQTLLRQLRVRFQRLPRTTTDVINATRDVAQLDVWLDRVVTAHTLEDVGIAAAS
jgi:hypothetical protein